MANQVIRIREVHSAHSPSHPVFQLTTRRMSTPGQRPGTRLDPRQRRRFSPEHQPVSRRLMKLFSRTRDTEFSWCCGHVHPCCRLKVTKSTLLFQKSTAPLKCSIGTCRSQDVHPLIEIHHTSRRRRCRSEAVARPYHDRDRKKKKILREVSCEMTTEHTFCATAVVVVQQL